MSANSSPALKPQAFQRHTAVLPALQSLITHYYHTFLLAAQTPASTQVTTQSFPVYNLVEFTCISDAATGDVRELDVKAAQSMSSLLWSQRAIRTPRGQFAVVRLDDFTSDRLSGHAARTQHLLHINTHIFLLIVLKQARISSTSSSRTRHLTLNQSYPRCQMQSRRIRHEAKE